MPVDPSAPPPHDPTSRLHQEVASLRRELRNLRATISGGAVSQFAVVPSLPTAGRRGRVVILDTDGKIYRDTGTAWVLVG